MHPDCLDFWLIAAYAELDLKGNLFSSRNLMLQALKVNHHATWSHASSASRQTHDAGNSGKVMKVNETKPRFYTEYLKFEVIFLDKLMQRRQLLNGVGQKASKTDDKA